MNRAGRLEGKTALITGGTTGIGYATAQLFLSEGARVAITGQNEERLARAAEQLGDVLAIRCDAGDLADLEPMAQQLEARFGRLDVLFLNAGLARYGTLEQITEADFDRIFSVNVKGVVFPVQRLAPLLNDGGSIIVTTSNTNRFGMPSAHLYTATKAAARQLVRTLAGELAPRGIRVNALSPGPTITEAGAMTGLRDDQLGAMGAWATEAVPLHRFAAAREQATAALFLASGDSSYMNGEEIVLDGGMTSVSTTLKIPA